MKKLFPMPDWKEDWKKSYPYDQLEIYGEIGANIGYAYAYEQRKSQTLALIKKVANQGDKILDVAAAQGNFSLLFAEMGYDVTWNDIRTDLAEYTEMKREKGMITYKPGNAFEVKFDNLFDVVLATEIIEHVAHPDEFLFKLSKLIKPKGHIVITTPLGSYFTNKLPKFTEFANPEVFEQKQFGPNSNDHIFLLHTDEMNKIANDAGLEVVSMKYYTNPLTNGHVGLNNLLKIIPKGMVMAIEKITQKLPSFIGRKMHNGFAILLRKKQ